MEFKGTKGEWSVCEMDDTFIKSKQNGANICTMDGANYEFNEKINNANLIATAPEMLQTLIDIFKYGEENGYHFGKIEKVINKALGK